MINKTILDLKEERKVSYLPREFVFSSDLEIVKTHAINMNVLLRTINVDDSTSKKRHEIRMELHRLVMWLYAFNINMTNLLTSQKPITE